MKCLKLKSLFCVIKLAAQSGIMAAKWFGGSYVSAGKERTPHLRSYFVDESGDGVIFDKRGRVLLGSDGCPKHFILGLLDVADPSKLHHALEELRQKLMNDPYFKDVPSMQEARKTAVHFHAKDDVPEVRREVFRLLLDHDVKFSAVVKNMHSVLQYVRGRNQVDASYRYHPDELYDHAARRLFKQRLHKDDEYNIYFARRGRSDRTRVLAEALDMARERFCRENAIQTESIVRVVSAFPCEHGGLQAADYFLWALQRAFERQEDRFIQLVWPKVSLIHDVDDTTRLGSVLHEETTTHFGVIKKRASDIGHSRLTGASHGMEPSFIRRPNNRLAPSPAEVKSITKGVVKRTLPGSDGGRNRGRRARLPAFQRRLPNNLLHLCQSRSVDKGLLAALDSVRLREACPVEQVHRGPKPYTKAGTATDFLTFLH